MMMTMKEKREMQVNGRDEGRRKNPDSQRKEETGKEKMQRKTVSQTDEKKKRDGRDAMDEGRR